MIVDLVSHGFSYFDNDNFSKDLLLLLWCGWMCVYVCLCVCQCACEREMLDHMTLEQIPIELAWLVPLVGHGGCLLHASIHSSVSFGVVQWRRRWQGSSNRVKILCGSPAPSPQVSMAALVPQQTGQFIKHSNGIASLQAAFSIAFTLTEFAIVMIDVGVLGCRLVGGLWSTKG